MIVTQTQLFSAQEPRAEAPKGALPKLRVIYEPRGRAREYAPLALNIAQGCNHGCTYCYAPLIMKKRRELYGENVAPRNIMRPLEQDCQALQGRHDVGPVLLCFTCDPYQPVPSVLGATHQALALLHRYEVPFQILTKGGSRARQDFDLYGPHDALAATLTFVDEAKSLHWEPGAATPQNRFRTLQDAHEMGITTWASLEPVIEPEEALEIIRTTSEYVDLYKVGPLNHHKAARGVDWQKFGHDVVTLLDSLGCRYYLKNDMVSKMAAEDLHGKGRKA